jgi:hypothetical protein
MQVIQYNKIVQNSKGTYFFQITIKSSGTFYIFSSLRSTLSAKNRVPTFIYALAPIIQLDPTIIHHLFLLFCTIYFQLFLNLLFISVDKYIQLFSGYNYVLPNSKMQLGYRTCFTQPRLDQYTICDFICLVAKIFECFESPFLYLDFYP